MNLRLGWDNWQQGLTKLCTGYECTLTLVSHANIAAGFDKYFDFWIAKFLSRAASLDGIPG